MEREQPPDPKIASLLREIGHIIGGAIDGYNMNAGNERFGFALFMFQFGHGDDHRISYISNSNREDMLATLKEFIAKAEGRYHT